MITSLKTSFKWMICLAVITIIEGGAFKDDDKVILYVNKVGPYFNPQETYHYYQLPVCRPEKVEHKSLSLGEVLDGDRMAVSNYDIRFKVGLEDQKLCNLTMSEADVNQFRDAIEELYYFEFVIDELPVREFVGHLVEGGFLPHNHKIYLWTHLTFNFEYNNDKIISANVTTRGHSPINLDNVKLPLQVTFTYSVRWHSTSLTEDDRLRLARKSSFFPRTLEVHWLSILNSAILVMLLMGFVTVILTRILRNDFARYNADGEQMDSIDADEYGWKIIYTDVFRFPKNKSLFCSILGVGSQFLALAFGIMFMAILDIFNVHKHGAMNTAACVLYALTSFIAGYVSSLMYHQIGGQTWVMNINLTSCLFSVPFFIIWSIQNSVAWAYSSTQALPAATIALLIAVWLFIGYPLTIIGGIMGKNTSSDFAAPCRTKNIAREIPSTTWYRSGFVHCAIGGFLPFSAISVELYYIFATVWGREQYTLYGILLAVFFILLSVTACISVALTYFQLSAEDYRWWWRSIFSSGSTSIFVFFYALFYFYRRSNMEGALQAVQFFGYTLLTCYVFFLTLGTVSFFASLRFVRYIYCNIKMD